MRVIYQEIRHARYLHIKRNVENVWGARYALGARYLSKNTVHILSMCPWLSSKQCACAVLYWHLRSLRLHHIFLSFHKRHDFLEKFNEHEIRVF